MTKKNAPISQRAYALHRDCARSTVQEAIKRGTLSASLNSKKQIKSYEAADAEWAANTRQSPEGSADDTLAERSLPDSKVSYTEARRRKEIQNLIQSKLATEQSELDTAERRGDLISKKEMGARLTTEYTHIRTKLLGLPTRCRQRLQHLTASDVQVINSLVREALEGLADGG